MTNKNKHLIETLLKELDQANQSKYLTAKQAEEQYGINANRRPKRDKEKTTEWKKDSIKKSIGKYRS